MVKGLSSPGGAVGLYCCLRFCICWSHAPGCEHNNDVLKSASCSPRWIIKTPAGSTDPDRSCHLQTGLGFSLRIFTDYAVLYEPLYNSTIGRHTREQLVTSALQLLKLLFKGDDRSEMKGFACAYE